MTEVTRCDGKKKPRNGAFSFGSARGFWFLRLILEKLADAAADEPPQRFALCNVSTQAAARSHFVARNACQIATL